MKIKQKQTQTHIHTHTQCQVLLEYYTRTLIIYTWLINKSLYLHRSKTIKRKIINFVCKIWFFVFHYHLKPMLVQPGVIRKIAERTIYSTISAFPRLNIVHRFVVSKINVTTSVQQLQKYSWIHAGEFCEHIRHYIGQRV